MTCCGNSLALDRKQLRSCTRGVLWPRSAVDISQRHHKMHSSGPKQGIRDPIGGRVPAVAVEIAYCWSKLYVRSFLEAVPGLGALVRACRSRRFPGSAAYWEKRYRLGLGSGGGSRGKLAEFKAEVVNDFIREKRLECASYVGLDVSPSAVRLCIERFRDDASKSFFLYDRECFRDARGVFASDLAISLDVIYHLVEDCAYHDYLRHVFQSAERYVMLYTAAFPKTGLKGHICHRDAKDDVAKTFPGWRLAQVVRNRYPSEEYGAQGSPAEFLVYEKAPA